MREFLRRALTTSGRHYPLQSGCGKIASQGFLRRLADGEQSKPVVTTLRNGARICVDLDDYIGAAIFYFGDFDPKVTWVLERVLRPGDTVVDVGANAGVVTLVAANLVGGTGAVHAVEPQPTVAGMLRRSVALNGFEHAHVHELALSDRDGVVDLWTREGHTGMATLEPTVDAPRSVIRVPVRRAGDFLRDVSSVRPRLLKLDVEGHEAAIVRGARDYLEASGPEVVLFEERRRPPSRQESVIDLQGAGYDVFAIPKAMFRMRLQRVGDAESATANDFVALRRACEDEAVISGLKIPR